MGFHSVLRARIRHLLWLSVFMTTSFLSSCGECNAAATEAYEPAPNCGRLECPPYTVLHSEEQFEIRSYDKALWVSGPRINSTSYREAAGRGFRILYGYFKGNNSQGVKINMTAPVLVDIYKDTFYKVHFYVPKGYQNNLPTPLNGYVKPTRLPQHRYAAVRRFGGLMNNTNIAEEVTALRTSLQGTRYRAAATANCVAVAGYTRPTQVDNRVNEAILWFD